MRLLCRHANARQVDHIFPVVGAYTEQLQQYEAAVLAGGLPSAASTRELHAMQRDLRRIDRTIAPLQVRTVRMPYGVGAVQATIHRADRTWPRGRQGCWPHCITNTVPVLLLCTNMLLYCLYSAGSW